MFPNIFYVALPLITVAAAVSASSDCKCGPNDSCWPSSATWQLLNSTVSGKLIKTTPSGITCYPGPEQDLETCAAVVTQLSNETLVGEDPIALVFPLNTVVGCPPIDFSAGGNLSVAANCTLGDAPRYVVNATTPEDVAQGIIFAKEHNLRLVIRNTGHDLLGRSTGYGSLEVWIRYLRQGITFQKTYTSSNGCANTDWNGSAIEIAGGYVWGDVLAVAKDENVIVVSGSDPTVGCIGGWAQGGGHSPASRDYGLGVLQILEAQVVLANGSIVTANACENPDLFFAIRGGGGGTYGVVTSTIVKAYPTKPVSASVLLMGALSDANVPEFMEALELIYSSYPDINDAGMSGYSMWAVQAPSPVFANFTTGFNFELGAIDKPMNETQALLAPLMTQLAKYNSSLYISATYPTFSTYAAYYEALSDGTSSAGSGNSAGGSRLLNREALTLSNPNLSDMLKSIAGSPGESTSITTCIVGGGANFNADPTAALYPGWHTSYVHQIVGRSWAAGTSAAEIQAIRDDVRNNIIGSMKTLSPDTGCYMNECGWDDPDYLMDFYGDNLPRLQYVKAQYDPDDLFYCPTCVGSDGWVLQTNGTLCRKE